jgi:hypothetical protein
MSWSEGQITQHLQGLKKDWGAQWSAFSGRVHRALIRERVYFAATALDRDDIQISRLEELEDILLTRMGLDHGD